MEGPLSYREMYLEADGQKCLYSRVVDNKTLRDVITEIHDASFDLHVVVDRCLIGTSTYVCTDHRLMVEHEDGACVGFLHRFLQNESQPFFEL